MSDIAVLRDSFLAGPTTPTGTYTVVGVTDFDPAVAVQVNAYNGTHTSWTHWFIRGIPTDQVKPTEPFSLKALADLVAPWPANMATYEAALVANAVIHSKKPGPGFTDYAIATTSFNLPMVIRKAGRPFKLRRGRRVIV